MSAEAERLRLAIRALTRVARLLESTDSGMSIAQFRMLAELSYGSARASALAGALRVSKPTVTAMADTLISNGLVARTSDPADRRGVRLTLTDAGRAALEKADRAYADQLAPVLAALEDPDQLVGNLVELREVLTR